MNPEARLREIGAEVARLGTEVQILDEQMAFQAGVADDARIRAVVSETPLADREESEAVSDLARLRRSRDEAAAQIEALRTEQDRLLEEILKLM